jgi:outer membrane protein OmpA-like peptidoglycan-associated protein
MRPFLLTLAVLYYGVAPAQLAAVIQDDFSSNTNFWETSTTKLLAGGTYTINASLDGDESLISRYIDAGEDFTLAAEFAQLSGSNECAFGITWGDSEENYNLYLISSSGEYLVYSGNPAQAKGWKKSGTLRAQGQTHRLRIERTAAKITFFINDIRIDERKSMPVYGNWLGIIVFDQGRVQVDNFQFLQNQKIETPSTEAAYQKEDLGPLINSHDDELGPIITSDGKTLYFARQNVPENTGGTDDDEDVWVSAYQNNRWTLARNMGRPVNTTGADNLVSVSADNNSLVFAKSNQLFVKHRTTNGWSEPEKLSMNFENQSEYFVASVTADNKAIVFSAKLKSNLFYDEKRNECDLYICLKDKAGVWSAPINFGPVINTRGNETSPYLSADGRTLYFATDGRPGLGSQDIFFARRVGDSWTNWTAPRNLGRNVNTPGFDAYYTVPASGEFAYFVSQSKEGKADIYRIRLHEEVKPQPVMVVSGLVLDSKTGKPLSARIHFEDLADGVEVGEARSDPKTGAYRIILPFGTNYGIRANVNDYYSVHENIALQESSREYTELRKDLLLVPLRVGETVKLNNVFFEAGLPALMPQSYPELNRLIDVLKENPSIAIDLSGHTDHGGDANTLLRLSQNRVLTVKGYLVAHGITEDRITGTGYGDTRPLAAGDGEESRRMNRRVEFKITKK